MAVASAMPSALRFTELFVIPGLVVVNAIAITLLVLHLKGWTGSTNAAVWIRENRTAVGIIVQLIAHLLGLLLLQKICKATCSSDRAFVR